MAWFSPVIDFADTFGMIQELPEGVVTFLFTDVEGSTRMFEQAPDLMLEALRQHDKAIDEAVAAHGGVLVRPRGEGDSRFIVFANTHDAVAGARRRCHERSFTQSQIIKNRAAYPEAQPSRLQLGLGCSCF